MSDALYVVCEHTLTCERIRTRLGRIRTRVCVCVQARSSERVGGDTPGGETTRRQRVSTHRHTLTRSFASTQQQQQQRNVYEVYKERIRPHRGTYTFFKRIVYELGRACGVVR